MSGHVWSRGGVIVLRLEAVSTREVRRRRSLARRPPERAARYFRAITAIGIAASDLRHLSHQALLQLDRFEPEADEAVVHDEEVVLVRLHARVLDVVDRRVREL